MTAEGDLENVGQVADIRSVELGFLAVDPDVDLAAQPYSLSSASWIMPLVKPLPGPAEIRGD